MYKNKLLQKYLELLNYREIPDFLIKYLDSPSLIRLKNIGYFCGMDYASKSIYDFGGYVSRFDHSLTTALLTWYCIKDKKATIAALFHDSSTPCFSHVIDYMNKDYEKQESTEEKIEKILKEDVCFLKFLNEDNILFEEISDFKKYSIVDLDRPMLCADRIDGIILNSLFWTKDISINEIEYIINSIKIYLNENNKLEIGFDNEEVAKIILNKNNLIDIYCHSKEDNYMMELLADITRMGINNKDFSYDDLYLLTEKDIINKILNTKNKYLLEKWYLFTNIEKEKIPNINLPLVKKRIIRPLVNGKRIDFA